MTDCSLGGGHLAPCASHADCADGLYCELHHEHKEGDDPGACKTKALPGQFCQHTAECEASLCGIRHNGQVLIAQFKLLLDRLITVRDAGMESALSPPGITARSATMNFPASRNSPASTSAPNRRGGGGSA